MAIIAAVSSISVFFVLYASTFSGFASSAIVTLDSIEIYKTHEILKAVKPEVYFRCKGENATDLPDVKNSNQLYEFKGEESWQPLTELLDKKCKRCGFYERDMIKSDDVYDEWEFCPSDFSADGKYIRLKDKEVNAKFSCPECIPFVSPLVSSKDSHEGGKGVHVAVIILISVVVSTVLVLVLIVAYKYWQKRKREQDQARFLKLFEDGDDIEDDLGLGNVL